MAALGKVWNNMSRLININWKTQYSIGFLILIALIDIKKETLWNKFYIQEIKTQLLSPNCSIHFPLCNFNTYSKKKIIMIRIY